MSDVNAPRSRIYTVPTRPSAQGELLAMREWRLWSQEGRAVLTSLSGEPVWDGPVLRSPWSPERPHEPSAGVRGINPRNRRFFWNAEYFFAARTWLWGWVALSGRVEDWRIGWRAEVAAIRHLRLGAQTLAIFETRDDARGLVKELEDRYQCPVKIGYPEWRLSRALIAQQAR